MPGLQPAPVLLTTSEYTPVTVGVIVGDCIEELYPAGPVQDHAVALLELSFSVTLPPTHIGPVLVAPLDVGAGFTVTEVVYTVAGLQPLPELLTISE